MSLLSLLAALLHNKVCFSRQWQNLFDSQELYQNSMEKSHLDQVYRNAENSTALSSESWEFKQMNKLARGSSDM